MAYERLWPGISMPFSSNGTARGTFKVADTEGLYVKQIVQLTSLSQPLLQLQIKRIDDDGTVYVGDQSKDITDRTDVSAYLVADTATVTANEQRIPSIKLEDIINAIYERDPIKALRVLGVDSHGIPFSDSNPLPVSFSATFPNTVEIASGDGSGYKLIVNSDGTITVVTQKIKTPTIVNQPIVTAGTEQSYALPSGTVRYLIQSRTGIAKLQIAYASGASSTDFFTIPKGCQYVEDGLDPSTPFTLYYQGDKVGEVVEILSWKS